MSVRLLFIVLIFAAANFTSSCQDSKDKDENGRNPIDSRLVGRWDVLSETDTEEVGGVVKETDHKVYRPGEKTFEFTADRKLIVTDGFGRHLTTLPVRMAEGKLYIGHFHTNKEPYTLTFKENGLAMVKKEEEQESGQIARQQEAVVLERRL